MKRLIIIVSAVVVSVGVVFFLNNKSSQPAAGNTQDVEVAEKKSIALSKEIESVNGQLIDVREPSEYEESHADNAVLVPLGDILKGDFSKIDSSRPIYLICRSGNRAGQAKAALEQAGYKDVTNIGGLVSWEAQGDKVCSTSTPSCS